MWIRTTCGKNSHVLSFLRLPSEVFYQLSAQIILLLFSWSSTKTTSGLEEMNKNTDPRVLLFSIFLSWKSICFTSFKTITLAKPFLPFKTKFLLFLWIVISATIRVLVLVAYFTPGFGLFDILYHWKYEQTKYSDKLNDKLMNTSMVFLYNATVSWRDINRWDYSAPSHPSPPSYTLYTTYSLKEYFLGLWIILAFHTFANVMIKIATSEHFRRHCSSLLEMFVHGFENTNICIVWRDWDEDTGTVKECKMRRRYVLAEMILTMLVKAAVHALMVTPIFMTGMNNTFGAES